MSQEVNEANFQEEVLKSSVPVLVDFYANWCGPCRALAPILEDISKEADGKYKIVKVDCDNNGNLARQYNVNALPTLLLFKNGVEVKRRVGLATKESLLALISE